VARRTFDVVDVTEILIHWHAGRSQSEIAASLGVDRKTVKKYVSPALAAGVSPGDRARPKSEWEQLVRGWFPGLADTRLRQITWPEFDRHRDLIAELLAAGVTKATIWQRLRDEHGVVASAASLKRWIAATLPEQGVRERVTVLREDPPAGAEAQIDYGFLGSWTDPVGGRRRRVWAFVMLLSFSRHVFVRPVLTMDQHAWTAAHVAGFEFFGGVPARLVPDNLRTGVDRSDLYDPKINRSYAELAEHYGTLIDPARARKPKDKPRVERQMPYVRDSFWRGRTFGSLQQMQAEAEYWCREVAARRSSRPLGGAQPGAVFAAAEADELGPLPRNQFVLARWSTATVGPDIHVKVGRALYSVPWRHIGQRVDARATATSVQIFARGDDGVSQLIATHPVSTSARLKRTELAHYPPEKIAFRMRTPVWCRTRASEIGQNTTAVIGELLAVNALFRLRAAQGVLGLADKHGPARLERAAGKALAAGDPSYRTIRGILAAGLETEPAPPTTGDGGAAAFLHGPSRLFVNVIPMPTTTDAHDPDGTTNATPQITQDGQQGASGAEGEVSA
jgi:transposase